MPETLQQLGSLQLRKEIRDLGSIDQRLEGIFSPGYSESEISSHIHETFLGKAEQYLSFCPLDRAHIEHWKELIQTAIGAHLRGGPLVVVDIGSGGGTSVFPMLELLPDAHVVATDLSLPLLAQLRNYARREGLSARLTVMQMNAEDMVFDDAQADIVTGAHILHHAVSLERALSEVRRILKPDGVAVFWEPFEGGAQIIAAIFELLLEANLHRKEKLPRGMPEAMRTFCADVIRRRGRNKPMDVLLSLDDKWYFTHRWLTEVAASAGFSRLQINSCYHTYNVVWNMTCFELKRYGLSPEKLPLWAREKILNIQDRYSEDWLAENLFAAAIILEGNRPRLAET